MQVRLLYDCKVRGKEMKKGTEINLTIEEANGFIKLKKAEKIVLHEKEEPVNFGPRKQKKK